METATRLLHQAREQFLSVGQLDPQYAALVRPEILTSWRRSRLSGASATMAMLPTGADLGTDSQLCRAATPVLAQLAQQLSGLQAGVLLADRYARIIGRWTPETNILPKMDRVASAAGSSGSEELVGTNGIGTIVEDRKPHMIVGAEHYSDMLTSFTCIGAPIFNPLTRKFEGVVTMNCDATEASPLLTSLIATTAKDVENRMLELSSRRERALLDAFVMSSRAGRGIAVIGEDVLLAGPQAASAFRSLDQVMVWQLIQQDMAARRRSAVLVVPAQDGSMATLSYTPILLDEKAIGATVERLTAHSVDAPAPTERVSQMPSPLPVAFDRVPGHSQVWQATLTRAIEYRESSAPLLIIGESGTGKLELAKALFHDRPIKVVDCLTPGSEGLNWVTSLGCDLPPAGVLVLRHVLSLSEAQAGALSARIDEFASMTDGPRIVGTGSRQLEQPSSRMQRLLDQLGVLTVEMPPLRDRAQDIPDLVRQLNERYAGLTPIRFSAAAMRALTCAPWPGNIRQLERVVRGIAAGGSAREVTPDLLPDNLGTYASGRTLTKMEQLERNAILEANDATNGNKVEMAKRLGISRSTLYRKMRYFRIDVERAA